MRSKIKKMKKTLVLIIASSIILLTSSCEEKKTTTPSTTTTTTSTTATTSTTSTTGTNENYFVKGTFNGKVYEFKNLIGDRDLSSDPANPSLTVIGVISSSVQYPRVEFLLKNATTVWPNNIAFVLNSSTTNNMVFVESANKTYNSLGLNGDDENLNLNFSKCDYVPNGLIQGSFTGVLGLEGELTRINVEEGSFSLKLSNK